MSSTVNTSSETSINPEKTNSEDQFPDIPTFPPTGNRIIDTLFAPGFSSAKRFILNIIFAGLFLTILFVFITLGASAPPMLRYNLIGFTILSVGLFLSIQWFFYQLDDETRAGKIPQNAKKIQ